jgi:hypothetical protein
LNLDNSSTLETDSAPLPPYYFLIKRPGTPPLPPYRGVRGGDPRRGGDPHVVGGTPGPPDRGAWGAILFNKVVGGRGGFLTKVGAW